MKYLVYLHVKWELTDIREPDHANVLLIYWNINLKSQKVFLVNVLD